VGLTRNNGSYPHEDISTVTGHIGNGSGVPRKGPGRDADHTWEKGGMRIVNEYDSFRRRV